MFCVIIIIVIIIIIIIIIILVIIILLLLLLLLLYAEIMDLQKFVSVALHTSAGEGDLSSDKLSNLKMAGSGYGPLIYNLFHDPSFEVFQNCCEEVWKSLEQMPNLPVLLVSTARQ